MTGGDGPSQTRPFCLASRCGRDCVKPHGVNGETAMTETDREKLIREYAAGEITWRALRERSFDDYVQMLGALGELDLAEKARAA
jgi:hypothetical protein